MDFTDKLDPELAAALQTFPAEGINWQDLPATRSAFEQQLEAMRRDFPDSPHVVKEDRIVPGRAGSPDVPVRIYRPIGSGDSLPCLVWAHGGGYVLGSIARTDLGMQRIVEVVGCTVVSVEYRLAPEHPFPAPLEDCYAALTWTVDHAAGLGIDARRVAVGGASAGGGLAAGLALLARDRGEVPIAFQFLVYPMLDDRNVVFSNRAVTDPRVWNLTSNRNGWRAYLAAEPGGDAISPYAAAARGTDLRNLPPAYVSVGTQDLFVDEDIAYAQRLIAADVPVELHVYPGAFHGAEVLVPAAALSQRMLVDQDQALKRVLHPPSAPRRAMLSA
jgi:acetyl esterase/lipase